MRDVIARNCIQTCSGSEHTHILSRIDSSSAGVLRFSREQCHVQSELCSVVFVDLAGELTAEEQMECAQLGGL